MSKCLMLFVVFGIAFTGLTSYAEPKNVISVAPLGFLLGLADVEYERAVADFLGIAGRGAFYTRKSGDVTGTGFGAGASARFYPMRSAPKRFFADVGFNYLKITAKSGDDEASANAYNVDFNLGWRWLIGDVFAIALGGGGSYYIGNDISVGGAVYEYSGILPSLVFNLGVGF